MTEAEIRKRFNRLHELSTKECRGEAQEATQQEIIEISFELAEELVVVLFKLINAATYQGSE